MGKSLSIRMRMRGLERTSDCAGAEQRRRDFHGQGGGAIVFDGAAIVDAKAKVQLSRRRRAEAATVDTGAVRRMAAAQFT